jgi:hypothetical protein
MKGKLDSPQWDPQQVFSLALTYVDVVLVIPVSVVSAPACVLSLVSVNTILSVSVNIESYPVIGKCLVFFVDVGKHHLSMSVNIESFPRSSVNV